MVGEARKEVGEGREKMRCSDPAMASRVKEVGAAARVGESGSARCWGEVREDGSDAQWREAWKEGGRGGGQQERERSQSSDLAMCGGERRRGWR